MKVIFLDFDGVINNSHDRSVAVKEEFVKELKKVISRTHAKIVVTSSHRNDVRFITLLEQMGVEIYDYLPELREEKKKIKENEKFPII